jgi:hypothetical protein
VALDRTCCLHSFLFQRTLLHLTFCWPCIIMYHNNVTNLIHFYFHNHFIVSWFFTCFGRQASIFRRHYTSSFLVWVACTVAFGWLQVVESCYICLQSIRTILVALAKFQRRLFSSSFCPSVCPHGATRLPTDGFSWNLIFEDFSKICEENSSSIKIGQE